MFSTDSKSKSSETNSPNNNYTEGIESANHFHKCKTYLSTEKSDSFDENYVYIYDDVTPRNNQGKK